MPGLRIPFLVENRAIHLDADHSPSLSLEAKQVVKIPSSLGQTLHVVLQGALKEHSGTPPSVLLHSLPSVSLRCPDSSAFQDPDHKVK